MRIRVLMVNGEMHPTAPDAEMLKERGFAVYNCTDAIATEVAKEIRPDVIFINPDNPGLGSTKVYHEILDDVAFASIPVIYTLSEDDVYLVNKKRTGSRDRRNIITDNIIDGIRSSLLDVKMPKRKRRESIELYDSLNISYRHSA